MNGVSENRLVAIESAVAHLQHDYELLHQAILELRSEFLQLRQAMARLEFRMTTDQHRLENRSPEIERPPHY